MCEDVTGVKLDEVCDLAGVQVDANGVVDLDEGVWVADGASVVCHQVRDSLSAHEQLLHLTQLILKQEEETGQGTGTSHTLITHTETDRCCCSPWPPRR